MTITTIAFDGIHRSGKWTQLSLIKEKLEEIGIPTLTMRWEYYRYGSGENDITDPHSTRRQEQRYTENYDQKSNRLNRELRYLYQKKLKQYLIDNKLDNLVILLDRSIVWKYMFNHATNRSNQHTNIIQHGKHNSFIDHVVVPNLIFVLQPSYNAILDRLEKTKTRDKILWDTHENHMRNSYKEEFITNSYHAYYSGLEFIPPHISQNIYHIKSDEDNKTIHNLTRSAVEKILARKANNVDEQTNSI